MILPSLMLQKPSAKSKAKDHSNCLARRLKLWRNGKIETILKETKHIQKKFTTSKKARFMHDISRIFAKLVMEGKISAAIKFLDKESSSGVSELSDSVIKELQTKHPPPAPIADSSLLYGPIDFVPKCFFDSINEESVLKAALMTKGSAGPSGMDADIYRRIFCSKNFSRVGRELREEIATLTKNLLRTSYHPIFVEAYTSSRLLPLDKNPGIRPIGVGEVLRRIVGKIIS